jgi:hypothetical protein
MARIYTFSGFVYDFSLHSEQVGIGDFISASRVVRYKSGHFLPEVWSYRQKRQ